MHILATTRAMVCRCPQRAPNAWGFYDMLGNVGEWVLMADGTPVVAGAAFADREADVQVTARAKFGKSWGKSDDMDPPSRWWLTTRHSLAFGSSATHDDSRTAEVHCKKSHICIA